ncbi:hypothetical protein RB195_004551 [Necator americanus]|uniref:Uncharacterized protein n=1 Tax=Necator americanus TaxID=51031 RepID=A0ABR1BIJ7_NECAM
MSSAASPRHNIRVDLARATVPQRGVTSPALSPRRPQSRQESVKKKYVRHGTQIKHVRSDPTLFSGERTAHV